MAGGTAGLFATSKAQGDAEAQQGKNYSSFYAIPLLLSLSWLPVISWSPGRKRGTMEVWAFPCEPGNQPELLSQARQEHCLGQSTPQGWAITHHGRDTEAHGWRVPQNGELGWGNSNSPALCSQPWSKIDSCGEPLGVWMIADTSKSSSRHSAHHPSGIFAPPHYHEPSQASRPWAAAGMEPVEEPGLTVPPPHRGAPACPPQSHEVAGEQLQPWHVLQTSERRYGCAVLPARASSPAVSPAAVTAESVPANHQLSIPSTSSTLWGWNLENLGLVPSIATHFSCPCGQATKPRCTLVCLSQAGVRLQPFFSPLFWLVYLHYNLLGEEAVHAYLPNLI